jgi:hypothetical protein
MGFKYLFFLHLFSHFFPVFSSVSPTILFSYVCLWQKPWYFSNLSTLTNVVVKIWASLFLLVSFRYKFVIWNMIMC